MRNQPKRDVPCDQPKKRQRVQDPVEAVSYLCQGAAAAEQDGPAVRVSSEWQKAANDIRKFGEAVPLSDVISGSNRGQHLAASAPSTASDRVQAQAPVVVVCGTKNVGKSTFSTFLVNDLLKKYPTVAFLETDVGQPEFSAPGCLSLHIFSERLSSQPRVQLLEPLRCYFYGDISPKQDPEKYLRSTLALYSYFRQHGAQQQQAELPSIAVSEGHVPQSPSPSVANAERQMTAATPLVINTNGWIRGLGLDVLIDILRHVTPTHVVQILSPLTAKNLPPGAFWDPPSAEPSPVHIMNIPSALSGEEQRKGQQGGGGLENRNLRITALLRSACEGLTPVIHHSEEGTAYADTARALVHTRPYVVPLSQVQILHLHAVVPAGESLAVANAAIVGLTVRSTKILQSVSAGNAGAQIGIPNESTNDDLPLCIGLGLIRSIDVVGNRAYLLTNVPLRQLRRVNTFLVGKVEMPVRLLQWGPYSSPYLCHNSIATEGTGSAPIKSRNNLLRRAQVDA